MGQRFGLPAMRMLRSVQGKPRSASRCPTGAGACRKHFSVRTGTVMERSKIPLQKWVVGIFLHLSSLKGVSSMKLHRDLKITQKSAWFMLHRIREAYEKPGIIDGWPGGNR